MLSDQIKLEGSYKILCCEQILLQKLGCVLKINIYLKLTKKMYCYLKKWFY